MEPCRCRTTRLPCILTYIASQHYSQLLHPSLATDGFIVRWTSVSVTQCSAYTLVHHVSKPREHERVSFPPPPFCNPVHVLPSPLPRSSVFLPATTHRLRRKSRRPLLPAPATSPRILSASVPAVSREATEHWRAQLTSDFIGVGESVKTLIVCTSRARDRGSSERN